MRIAVYGSFEAAHRLTATPGNCANIHGHSFRVRLELTGKLDPYGMVRDFRDVKSQFRDYLATTWDHRCVLNAQDRLVELELPGLALMDCEPTTENIARYIGEWASDAWNEQVQVTLRETEHNEAIWP